MRRTPFEPMTVTIHGEPVTFDGRRVTKVSSEQLDATAENPNREWLEIEVIGVRPMQTERGIIVEDCELSRFCHYDAENTPNFVISVAYRQFIDGQLTERRETWPTASVGEFALCFVPSMLLGERLKSG